MKFRDSYLTVLPAAVLALVLAGCGGGGGTTAAPPAPEPEPTPAELAAKRAEEQMTLITSASQGLNTALMGLDTDSPTSAQMDDVDDAISLLESALAGAADLTPTQTAAAHSELAAAKRTVATARTTHRNAMDLAARRTMQMEDISTAQTNLATAIAALMADDAGSITAVNTGITALQGAVDAAADLSDAEKMSAMSDLTAAEVAAAKAELDMYEAAAMADGATMEAMLAAYEGKLMAAQRLNAADGASAADKVRANRAIGTATAKIAQLKEDIQDAADAMDLAERKKMNAMAMQVEKAIIAHTVPATPPGEFVTPATPLAGSGDTNFGVKRSSGDATISLTQTAAAAKKKPYMSASAPTAMGFMGRTYTASGMSGKRPFTEMAAVYTDIETAKDAPWTAANLDGVTADPVDGVVTFAEGADASRFTGILPAKPPAGGPNTENDYTARAATNGVDVGGTFYGVSGVYKCAAGATCTVTRTPADVVTITGFTFDPTPSAVGLMAKYATPDTDYTYFGYWMKSTTLRDGVMRHDIETFHGGMGALGGGATADLTMVEDTATYYGAAAGVYVKEDGAGDSLVVTNGTFTADAMLTARFGGTKIAEANQYQVEGTIFDFMDGSTALGFGDLMLRKAPMDLDQGATTRSEGTFSGETDGGGTSGNWRGRFHGNANPGDDLADGSGPDYTNDFPLNVSGEFNGHFEDGHVAGAFGAERDE